MKRIVVAIDPATSTSDESSETGIVVAGRCKDGEYWVLQDLSCRASPDTWARKAVGAYHLWNADRIVAEVNQGGDMVEKVIRTVGGDAISFKAIRASRGKFTRAEPIAALYEQDRVHHVGIFELLEDQMCSWVPGEAKSPDRLDALVWAVTDLVEKKPLTNICMTLMVSEPKWKC